MSRASLYLYEVLGEIVSSQQPIGEGDILQASQNIMRKKQRALRVLQAKKERANFTEEKAHQLQPVDEPTKADKLQLEHEGRQLGCLLVKKTKGETQLQVSRWLSATNMGSLEAIQLAAHKQEEHPLRASSKDHEHKLWWSASFLLATIQCLEGASG